jgi:hypothetical protein
LNAAANRSPFIAPPKFDAVYSVMPFVEEPIVANEAFSFGFAGDR